MRRRGRSPPSMWASGGLSEETVRNFALGYSPDDWHGLEKFARGKGFSPEEGAEAGLLVKNAKGNIYDRFRGRLMFPIHNLSGQVIAFGARTLTGDDPKYLNSSESPLYVKGDNLYGLFQARRTIAHLKEALLTEGLHRRPQSAPVRLHQRLRRAGHGADREPGPPPGGVLFARGAGLRRRRRGAQGGAAFGGNDPGAGHGLPRGGSARRRGCGQPVADARGRGLSRVDGGRARRAGLLPAYGERPIHPRSGGLGRDFSQAAGQPRVAITRHYAHSPAAGVQGRRFQKPPGQRGAPVSDDGAARHDRAAGPPGGGAGARSWTASFCALRSAIRST